jgi:hypothetical protein
MFVFRINFLSLMKKKKKKTYGCTLCLKREKGQKENPKNKKKRKEKKWMQAEDKNSGGTAKSGYRIRIHAHALTHIRLQTEKSLQTQNIDIFLFLFKLSLSMESLSSSLYLNQALTPRHPCPVKWRSSGSVLLLGFSSPCLKTPPFLRKGIIKASVAVEQQTQKTKTAVIRIGTRGRYFSLFPPLLLLRLS